MRVLVLGGTGMIGPGLVWALRVCGHDVTVLHRGITPFLFPADVRILRLDRRGPGFATAVDMDTFDAVVDLDCYTTEDVDALIEAIHARQRVMMVSSILVHGGDCERPLREDSPLHGVSDYARHKIRAEDAVRSAYEAGRIQATIVRLGACYRTGCYLDGQVFEDGYWLYQLAHNSQTVLADRGQSRWSVMHSNDAGLAMALLLGNPDAIGETVIVASDRTITWAEYYGIAARAIGVRFEPLCIPADWLVSFLGKDCFLAEMSRWHQDYDLSRLRDLAPGFREAQTPWQGLPDAVVWLLRHAPPSREGTSVREAEELVCAWQRGSDACAGADGFHHH